MPCSKCMAKKLARRMAREAGLDANTADAVAQSYAVIHDPEFTDREMQDFINEEIQKHAQA